MYYINIKTDCQKHNIFMWSKTNIIRLYTSIYVYSLYGAKKVKYDHSILPITTKRYLMHLFYPNLQNTMYTRMPL